MAMGFTKCAGGGFKKLASGGFTKCDCTVVCDSTTAYAVDLTGIWDGGPGCNFRVYIPPPVAQPLFVGKEPFICRYVNTGAGLGSDPTLTTSVGYTVMGSFPYDLAGTQALLVLDLVNVAGTVRWRLRVGIDAVIMFFIATIVITYLGPSTANAAGLYAWDSDDAGNCSNGFVPAVIPVT